MAGSIDYRVELEKALSSSTRLQPIHVEIVNDSTWYYMRNRLGPKRQSFYNIKYNEAHLYYEGYIYQMARREEDLKVVPKKVMVGHAADKWKAYKLCEKAIKERDSDVKSITMDMMERNIKVNLETHYRILVVSNSFIRVPPIERVAIVCEELLSALGSTPSLMATDISEMVPSRFRHVSTFGPNVLSLNLFTFLRNPGPKEVMLQIKAITPSQWKPSVYPAILSERLGKDHQHVATLGVPNAAKPPQQKRRVQKLTTSLSTSALPSAAPPTIVTVGDSKNGSVVSSLHSVASDDMSTALSVSEASESLPSDMQLQPELAETLGLHESISGVRYAKLGGIYGHFFNDLSQDVRAMVLERYQSNKHLIRLETHADPNVARDITAIPLEEEPSFKPKTNLSVMRAKAQVEANLLPPDRGTTNQEQMREEVLLSSRKIELLAIRLQRIRRIHATFKARRRIWWRYWACITLQRVVRGWFARRFVHLYRKLQPIAVRRIQTFYRNLRTNRVLYAWQMIAYRLTRVALRIIKRFFHKCYLSWVAKREHSASIIQTIARVRIAVTLKYRKMGVFHLINRAFPAAAVKIQSIVRGFLGRKKFWRHLDKELIRRVDTPAAQRLQRIFRGRLAKRLLAKKKQEKAAAISIQKLIRYYLRMCGVARMRRAALEIRSATKIQKLYRGCLDRKIYALKVYQHWYRVIYIPAIILIQSWIRGAVVRKKYYVLRRQNQAVQVIQRAFRFQKTRWLAKLQRQRILQTRRELKIRIIQAYVRRFLCQRKFRRNLLSYRGRVVFAAKLIARAWRSYKLQQKYQELLDEAKRESDILMIKKLFAVRQGILKDIKDIYNDIQHLDKSLQRVDERLLQIREFSAQASLRMTSIKREIDLLTVEDYERGWAEALGQEYEYMLQQTLMAREEERLLSHKEFKLTDEKVRLQLEIEENEVDLDGVEQKLRQVAHKAHRRELLTAERKAKFAFQKRLFREKVHWKIDSNRRLKMLRARERYHQIIRDSKATRGLDHATTVSFEKRAQREDYEKLLQERMLMEEASRRDQLAKPKTYEEYATPVMQTYDRIVARNLGILRGLNLDNRARSLKDYFLQQKAEQRKLRRGQFVALKPEFEDMNRPKLV